MRTKALILTAVLGVAAATTASAQVFSQNAVGYYNLTLGSGFTMIANQLNNGDNNLNTILPVVPDGSTFLTWNAAGQMFSGGDIHFAGAGWFDSATITPSTTVLGPGIGGFINLPVGASATVTMVGEVPQGTLTLDLAPNFQMISHMTPQELGMEASGFPAGDGDTILFWNPPAQSYDSAFIYFAGAGWFDSAASVLADPVPSLGEAMFYNRGVGNGTATWTRNFSVNP